MRIRRTLLVLGICTLATAGLSGLLHLTVSPAEADGEERKEVRLLLKCDASDVDAVLKALKGQPVEVYDLDTMKRRTVPVSADRVPHLPDAARLMESLITALQAVKDPHGVSLVKMEDMVIQPRRAMVTISASSQALLDQGTKALAKDKLLKERGAQESLGAIQTMPGGGYRTKISYKLDERAARSAKRPPATSSIPMVQIQNAGLAANMKFVYAGPVRTDPNRAAGYTTRSREYTYAPARLDQFRKLLTALTHAQGKPNGLIVHELRWKLADPKQQTGHPFDRIRKSTVMVGFRTPLGD